MLTSAKSFTKIEPIQKRVLGFMIKKYESSYEELLTGRPNMKLRRTNIPCIPIYKTLNNLNPEFMEDLFELRATKRVQR